MQGKRALVTGAASGIGKAVAEAFEREGAQVLRADLQESDNVLALDVTGEHGWERVLEAAGHIDALVACAGVSDARSIESTRLADWRRILAVNLDGGFLSVKYGARAIRRGGGGGTIVLVGSASGVKPVPLASAYCASKAGLRMLAKSAALELKAENIRVNCLSPAGVVSPMWTGMPFWKDLVEQHGGEEGAWKALGGADPATPSIQRMAFADEIAEVAVFLSCSQSAHITGADIAVDGGYTA
jgi:NAD(P)-dependent dehydrogenase (short-subunit alcohol dehydrogenase family)